MYDVLSKVLIPESKSDEEPCVAHIKFELIIIGCCRQTDIRIISMMRHIYGLAIFQTLQKFHLLIFFHLAYYR